MNFVVKVKWENSSTKVLVLIEHILKGLDRNVARATCGMWAVSCPGLYLVGGKLPFKYFIQ